MILIAIDREGAKWLLYGADTYIGTVYAQKGDTIDEIVSRFLPTLKAWGELGHAAAVSRSHGEMETRPKR